ncbi:hypothetical protein [Gordonia sp. NPDC127522]|uniref:hypothetical protein n=1 Tax=Gordonia sp. NPDC127522 TaxID=3345390 RepID=UPI003633943F
MRGRSGRRVPGERYVLRRRGRARRGGSTSTRLGDAGCRTLRNALLVLLVAGLVAQLDPDVTGALLLAAGLFLIPLVLFAGAVFHEGTALSAAAVHLGDWVLKLLILVLIVSLSR